jgi:hypothetical protein
LKKNLLFLKKKKQKDFYFPATCQWSNGLHLSASGEIKVFYPPGDRPASPKRDAGYA